MDLFGIDRLLAFDGAPVDGVRYGTTIDAAPMLLTLTTAPAVLGW